MKTLEPSVLRLRRKDRQLIAILPVYASFVGGSFLSEWTGVPVVIAIMSLLYLLLIWERGTWKVGRPGLLVAGATLALLPVLLFYGTQKHYRALVAACLVQFGFRAEEADVGANMLSLFLYLVPQGILLFAFVHAIRPRRTVRLAKSFRSMASVYWQSKNSVISGIGAWPVGIIVRLATGNDMIAIGAGTAAFWIIKRIISGRRELIAMDYLFFAIFVPYSTLLKWQSEAFGAMTKAQPPEPGVEMALLNLILLALPLFILTTSWTLWRSHAAREKFFKSWAPGWVGTPSKFDIVP